jgi:hypothetical protein
MSLVPGPRAQARATGRGVQAGATPVDGEPSRTRSGTRRGPRPGPGTTWDDMNRPEG